MEDWKKYLHQPKPVTQLLNDSIIVIDTNVLLAAYQWREVTVNEVLNALQKIKDEQRLRIPLQVIKEFSRNRPHEIQQRMNDLDTLISKMQKEKPLIERVPMLEGKDSLKKIEELRENYNKVIKDFKDELINLRDHLKELFYNDHFLDKIMELAEGTILLPEQTEQDLEKEAKERFKLKIPPGFKDSSKEENSAGDFIVWSSILQLKSNVVFVSGDKKPDWVYQDSKKNPITARRELVEEFFNKTGKDFAHITPKDFVTALNPGVSEHVKEDLSKYSFESSNETDDIISDKSIKLSLLIAEIEKNLIKISFKYNIAHGEQRNSLLTNIYKAGLLNRNDKEKIESIFRIRNNLAHNINFEDSYIYMTINLAENMIEKLKIILDGND
ncbi:PIN-like domain-containing protein [Bacillus inaquosorum]|uniref:PIN-like domain-containing protein n=1 Tax=Bacillus inaquosorum TaxID=483913 RepID=UPI002281A94B|nr:PIN-like domain-containing protein [Bacillus inaquosorum]MCY8281215.1 PIN-like domain-containing protein [Bacillus inaquosorum]